MASEPTSASPSERAEPLAGLPSAGEWGLVEACLGWLASTFVAGLLFVLALQSADFTSQPQRPGGYAGRAIGQVSTGQALEDTAFPIAWQLLLLFPGWIILLAVPWLFAGVLGRERPGWSLKGKPSDIGLGVISGLLLQVPILIVVVMVMRLVFGEFEPSGRALALVDAASASPLLVVLLVVCVAVGAPVVEELFYRGLLQPALIRLTNPVIGIAVASVLFGAVHFSVVELLPLSVVGLVFGLLAHRTGRLLPAIVAHMTFNSFTLALLLIAGTAS